MKAKIEQIILSALIFLATPLAVKGVTVEDLGTTLTLGTADLKATVINILQWVLGLLGLIAVAMIIYGVFGAITAGGNEDKAAFAKKTIIAAVIGLVVILLAWAIVVFVVNTTANVTE